MKTDISEKEAAFIAEHSGEDVSALRLKHSKTSVEGLDISFCCLQIESRKKFSSKLPSFVACSDFVFPPLLNSEQTSSEQTAVYKSELIASDCTIADLTCGTGIDAYFFARKAHSVLCVEKSEELCELTKRNFERLNAGNCSFISADCESVLSQIDALDVIFLDPSRRDENARRVYAIEDCSPDVSSLAPLLLSKAPHVIIKLSPMLDLKSVQRALPCVSDIHVVSVVNECKEILIELRRDFSGDLRFHAVDINDSERRMLSFTRPQSDANPCSANLATTIEEFIYEPSASLLKIGLYGTLIEKYGLKKLHPHSHLFTSSNLISDFQGRGFRLLKVRKADAKSLKDITKANISVRNFPQTVAEIRKKTKIREGGDVYLFFTTLAQGEKVCLECLKI